MQSKSHRKAGSPRTFVVLAITVVAATLTAGFALGHHPEAGAAARRAAAIAPLPTQAPAPARDPSLPVAAEVLAGAPASAATATPSF